MNKGLVKKIIVGALVGAMSLSVMACGKKEDTAKDTSLEKIKKAGKIVVGTSPDYPPYEFHKTINGKDEIVGFDIEIAKEIAKDLGVDLELKGMQFSALEGALPTNKVDLVIAGMNPTEERQKNIDFSKIYYIAEQGLLVKSEKKDSIKSLADLKGKKVGVQKGSVQEGLANDQLKDSQIKALGKISDLILELKTGKVDAIISELPVAKFYTDNNKDLSLSEAKFEMKDEEKGSAIAFKKDSTALVSEVNKTLDRLIKENKIENFVTEASKLVEAE